MPTSLCHLETLQIRPTANIFYFQGRADFQSAGGDYLAPLDVSFFRFLMSLSLNALLGFMVRAFLIHEKICYNLPFKVLHMKYSCVYERWRLCVSPPS